MKKKIINLSEERQKRKPLSLEEAAKIIFRKNFDPDFVATLGEEPVGLASGKTNAHGGFVRDDQEDFLADEDREDDNDTQP